MIKGLHHSAYRCRDSEETRVFYEDFLGLPLSGALEISETKSGRATKVLHSFFRLDDGSFLAFFEAIVKAKPSGAKGKYLQKAAVSSTMGPGVKIDTAELGA